MNKLQSADWTDVAARSMLPSSPLLLRGSPAQLWLAENPGLWEMGAIERFAMESQEASAIVELHSQNRSNDSPQRFLHHVRTVRSGGVTYEVADRPPHRRERVPLHGAVKRLWHGDEETTFAYCSVDMNDLPATLVRPLLQMLPAGCLCDDALAGREAPSRPAACGSCRGLEARLWLGSAGVSTAAHYDRKHNLFLQVSGRKRFVLLPPSAHRHLRLYPRWHGSQRQSRLHLPEWLARAPASTSGAFEVALGPGDLLFLPALWLHHVESLTHSSAVGLWTAGRALDAWAALDAPLKACGRHVMPAAAQAPCLGRTMGALLASVHGGTPGLQSQPSSPESCHASYQAGPSAAERQCGTTADTHPGVAWPLSLEPFVWTAEALAAPIEAVSPMAAARSLLEARALAVLEARYLLGGEDEAGSARDGSRSGNGVHIVRARCEAAVTPDGTATEGVGRMSDAVPWLVSTNISALAAATTALAALDAGARDLYLDDLLEDAAIWAVGQLGAVPTDGEAVQAFLQTCFGGLRR